MRRALALAAAGAALLAPGAAVARRGHHHHHHHRHRHYVDQPVTMPPRPPVVGPPAPKPPAPRALARMQVVAREFSLTLSRQSVAGGTVSVELDNHGEDPHDLRVERADDPATGFDFALTRPGGVATEKLDLAPGTWKLYCTLPGHAALGMSATVTVTG